MTFIIFDTRRGACRADSKRMSTTKIISTKLANMKGSDNFVANIYNKIYNKICYKIYSHFSGGLFASFSGKCHLFLSFLTLKVSESRWKMFRIHSRKFKKKASYFSKNLTAYIWKRENYNHLDAVWHWYHS